MGERRLRLGAGVGPDSNDTAAAIMALRVAGVPCSWKAVDHGYGFLHSLQRSDNGYALYPSSGSDSQSTSWAIQARIKCGLPKRRALAYLAARQLPAGLSTTSRAHHHPGLGDLAGAAGDQRAGYPIRP